MQALKTSCWEYGLMPNDVQDQIVNCKEEKVSGARLS